MSVPNQNVAVVDLRIPFFRLVLFFVKVALAMIPAAIILAFLLALAVAIIAAVFGVHGGWMIQHWSL